MECRSCAATRSLRPCQYCGHTFCGSHYIEMLDGTIAACMACAKVYARHQSKPDTAEPQRDLEADERLGALRRVVARARQQPEITSPPTQRIRRTPLSVLTAGVVMCLLHLVARIVGDSTSGSLGLDFLQAVSFYVFKFAGPAALLIGVCWCWFDWLATDAAWVRSPNETVSRYLDFTTSQRWAWADFCLSRAARGHVVAPAFPALRIEERDFCLNRSGGLEALWTAVAHDKSALWSRRVDIRNAAYRMEELEPGLVLTWNALRLERDTISVLANNITTESLDIEVPIALYLRDERWYVLTPGIDRDSREGSGLPAPCSCPAG